ncbi:MAG: hypothetical protein C4332_13500, partial [Meiothermus sp.]
MDAKSSRRGSAELRGWWGVSGNNRYTGGEPCDWQQSKPFDTSAYTYIIQNSPILNWYVNSVVTSVLITFFVLLLALLCAFALSQLEFPGKPWLYWIILAGFMIPFQASIVPLFMLMNKLGLVNSYGGIILPQLAAPLAVVIYKQFFDQVPKELGDAARIDGASEFRVLFGIFLPMNW